MDSHQGMTDKEADEAQEWKGMDGAIAYHLIDRHAENWNEIGAMMNAWLRANGGALPNAIAQGREHSERPAGAEG